MMFNLEYIIALYRKYAADLARARDAQRAFYSANGYLSDRGVSVFQHVAAAVRKVIIQTTKLSLLRPQFDDLEAEITYLLLRETRPANVVEISPCRGWSTTWILRALKDNGTGVLTSFDLVSWSRRFVPSDLAVGRWKLLLGPVQENLDRLPVRIDYLFLDSDHSADFARWYISTLFPRLPVGIPVGVHDVFRTEDPSGHDGEGQVLMSWLEQQGIPWFTASSAKAPDAYARLGAVKSELSLSQPIHSSTANSMVFFRSPGAQA